MTATWLLRMVIFVIRDGDIQLTGYQSRLESLTIWLHQKVCEKFLAEGPHKFVENMERFNEDFLKKPDYTPEYRMKLDALKASIRKEVQQNSGEKQNFWNTLLDVDNLELKPNIMGVGINFNEIINRFRNKT